MFLSQTNGDASEPRQLPPPPRAVPPGLARYLRWACLNIALTLIGFTLIAFWGDCGFGADVESLLFLAPLTHTTGTVSRTEGTGAREVTGSISPSTNHQASDVPSVPVYAVYFSYASPSGSRRKAVCYTLGENASTVLLAEGAEGQAALPLTPGASVVVETVEGGRFARIRGTRTNLYDIHMLIVLVFPGFGLFLLLGARRYLRRALPLLATGQEDPATAGIGDQTDASRSISLTTFPFNRVRAQGGVLQVPPLAMRVKIWIGPGLALICNVWYIADNAREIFYPLKALLELSR